MFSLTLILTFSGKLLIRLIGLEILNYKQIRASIITIPRDYDFITGEFITIIYLKLLKGVEIYISFLYNMFIYNEKICRATETQNQ